MSLDLLWSDRDDDRGPVALPQPVRQEGEQLQAGAVDPLHVLEDEDRGVLGCDALRDAQEGLVESQALEIVAAGGAARPRCRAVSPAPGASSGKQSGQLAPRRPEDAGQGSRRHLPHEVTQDLREGQVGDPGAEGQALAAEHLQLRSGQAKALVDEPGLADAGLAADDDDARLAVQQAREGLAEPSRFRCPTDQHRTGDVADSGPHHAGIVRRARCARKVALLAAVPLRVGTTAARRAPSRCLDAVLSWVSAWVDADEEERGECQGDDADADRDARPHGRISGPEVGIHDGAGDGQADGSGRWSWRCWRCP